MVCVSTHTLQTSAQAAFLWKRSRPEQASKGHDLGFGVGRRARSPFKPYPSEIYLVPAHYPYSQV